MDQLYAISGMRWLMAPEYPITLIGIPINAYLCIWKNLLKDVKIDCREKYIGFSTDY